MNELSESRFQSEVIHDIKKMFPDCIIMKLDANYIQGIPDLLILYGAHWATLECKKSITSSKRPNQKYYVNLMNEMSFSSFIYPENKEDVLHELQQAFKS